MITIKPYGGLGNRLRSLDSAVALAECTGKDLKVIWDRNEEFNCAFSRLFEETPVFDIKEISSSYFPRKIKEKLLLLAHKLKVKYPNQYDCILLESDIMKMKEENYNFCNLNTCNNLFININGRFLFPEKPYQYLKPVDFISKKVDSIVENFSPYTVGVHIRRTDNQFATQKSPLSKFIELMTAEKKDHQYLKFYLSTDSPETEKYLLEKFPNEVISFEKELRRDKEKGLQDALTDLLCLAKTSKIIGSYWSSFSEVASEIGKIPLTIAMG